MKQHLYFLTLVFLLVLVTFTENSFADVISPKKQASLSFAPNDIVCKEDLIKLFKKSNANATCVEPSSASKLVEFGWAYPLTDESKAEIIEKNAIPAGTIKHVVTLNQIGSSGRLDSTPRVNAYNFVFEACAGEKNIRAPEIIITSDSEVKPIKLVSMLKSDQCRTTSAIVKANDPQSISAVLLNKGGISKTINDLESKLTELLSELTQEKKLLASTHIDNSKKTSDIVQRITELKKDINSQRYELQKYHLFLFADTKKPSQLPTLTSFTGKEIDGLRADIVSVNKQVSQPKESEQIISYNVIFEACTGNQMIQIPMVTVSSDYESKDIKIAEKISPNSCQMSIAKIFAKDPKSITVSISSKQSISLKISEIEMAITELEDKLNTANKNLTNLLSKNLSEEKLSEDVSNTTILISDLRSEITVKKAEMASIMLQVYR